jgi:DNA primase
VAEAAGDILGGKIVDQVIDGTLDRLLRRFKIDDWNRPLSWHTLARPMPRIPEETVEQVLAATDIVDLIGSYFPVKRAGSSFKALCPFHNEKSPSFHINAATQHFHCFGCGESGSAVGFVMKYENLPFPDAVRKLAARAGIPIIEEALDPAAERSRRSRSRLIDLHREAAGFFHRLLLSDPAAKHARDYLKSRGFGREMAERWTIGWAPESPKSFLDFAREKGFSGRELADSGLAAQRQENNASSGLYLRFRDRLMFPIRNDYGDVIAFSARQLRDDPRSGKYINSPETPLFNKSKVIFALDRARKHMLKAGFALLCEGQIDAISCHEAGLENAIAPLGTAFTPHHARLLRRYTDTVVLCFDSDAAGVKATQRAFGELAAEGLAVRVAELPGGDDPDAFIRREGVEAFRTRLTEARGFFDYMVDRANRENSLANVTDRAKFARELAELVAAISDAVSRDALINHLATRLQIGAAEFRSAVDQALRNRRKPAATSDDTAAAPPVAPTPLDNTLAYLCFLALQSPEAQAWLAEQVETLIEISPFVEGTEILRKILARRPEAGNPNAVNAFTATLADADLKALRRDLTHLTQLPDHPLEAAAAAINQVSLRALKIRDARVRAALRDPSLPPERLVALMEETKEIKRLLGGAQPTTQ